MSVPLLVCNGGAGSVLESSGEFPESGCEIVRNKICDLDEY